MRLPDFPTGTQRRSMGHPCSTPETQLATHYSLLPSHDDLLSLVDVGLRLCKQTSRPQPQLLPGARRHAPQRALDIRPWSNIPRARDAAKLSRCPTPAPSLRAVRSSERADPGPRREYRHPDTRVPSCDVTSMSRESCRAPRESRTGWWRGARIVHSTCGHTGPGRLSRAANGRRRRSSRRSDPREADDEADAGMSVTHGHL